MLLSSLRFTQYLYADDYVEESYHQRRQSRESSSYILVGHILAVKGKYICPQNRLLTAQDLKGHLRIKEILDEELKT